MKDLLKTILKDVKVEAMELFDRNFERKAFFDKPWKGTNHPNARGSLMMRSGKLRKSIRGRVEGNSIVITSEVPYAKIHNEGGEIVVTAKMKRFFWAKYYEAAGGVTYSVKTKGVAKSQKNVRLVGEAAKWKAMALMKIGTKIKIEQRQFIGDHPQLRQAIEGVVQDVLKEFNLFKV